MVKENHSSDIGILIKKKVNVATGGNARVCFVAVGVVGLVLSGLVLRSAFKQGWGEIRRLSSEEASLQDDVSSATEHLAKLTQKLQDAEARLIALEASAARVQSEVREQSSHIASSENTVESTKKDLLALQQNSQHNFDEIQQSMRSLHSTLEASVDTVRAEKADYYRVNTESQESKQRDADLEKRVVARLQELERLVKESLPTPNAAAQKKQSLLRSAAANSQVDIDQMLIKKREAERRLFMPQANGGEIFGQQFVNSQLNAV